MLQPSDVFVPGKFPIERHNVYADRGAPQESFSVALSRGFVPLVHGSYGVGKSSLAMHCARSWQNQSRLVYIPSVYGKTLSDIFTVILEFVGYEVVVEASVGVETEVAAELGSALEGGFFTALKASISGKFSRRKKKALGEKRQILVKSPTDNRLFDLCEERALLLVIDEMHRADAKLKTDLSAFLKAYANRMPKHFRICILGTEKDSSKLVNRDPGVDRLLQEVELKPINAAEAAFIISDGMSKLALSYASADADKIVRCSVGSPFVMQYLCLEIAEKCFREGRQKFETTDITFALQRYANAKAQRVLAQYKAAIETTGTKRYRKQILHAMAHMDDDYVTMDQLVKGVSEQLQEAVQSTALSGPLRDLKGDACGKILADVEGIAPGERAYNYSAFSDAATKFIIRLIEEIETMRETAPNELKF